MINGEQQIGPSIAWLVKGSEDEMSAFIKTGLFILTLGLFLGAVKCGVQESFVRRAIDKAAFVETCSRESSSTRAINEEIMIYHSRLNKIIVVPASSVRD